LVPAAALVRAFGGFTSVSLLAFLELVHEADRRHRTRREQRGGRRKAPDGLGSATNTPGGMPIAGPELIRVEPDGSRVRHAVLSHISSLGWSEIAVDGRGNAYVSTIS
jgi:hypothetical protein